MNRKEYRAVCEKLDAMAQYVRDHFAHGSGINLDWNVVADVKHRRIVAHNSFHAMNDAGMYDGWADFSVVIPAEYPLEFKLHFHGQHSWYMSRKYSLREYLDDTFAYNAHEMARAFGLPERERRMAGGR